MSKFDGKFRKNQDYNDDYEYSKKVTSNKHRRSENAEMKKKLRQWQYENAEDLEEDYRHYA